MLEQKLFSDVEELSDVNPFQIRPNILKSRRDSIYNNIIGSYVESIKSGDEESKSIEEIDRSQAILRQVLEDFKDHKHVQLISGDVNDIRFSLAEFSSEENILQVYSRNESLNQDYFVALFNNHQDPVISERAAIFYKIVKE